MAKKNYVSANRRVVVIHASSLLAVGVQMILKEHRLEVTGVNAREQNMADLLNSLEAGDIVIVDSGDVEVRPYLSALQKLVQSSDVVLVCLSPEESTMEIYRKEMRTLGKLRDLFEVIWYA